ncbi:MAG TPA: tripartite tricarboxylate transporter substrate-binding protein [Acetobacteraceae bacterium]|nr:tripartite tricarboxylate transporter substrate-binding protein [Acetobacteraceae bacterium]
MRRMLLSALAAALPLLASASVRAQTAPAFPDRPIRMVVPYAPGGAADTSARLLIGPMGEFLGQTITIENRTGGGGTIGAAAVAQARADGYTLLGDASAHTVNHALVRNLPFDYARDFAPVSRLASFPLIFLVSSGEAAPDLAAYMAAARARSGRIAYSSAGVGSAAHLAGFLFAQRAGIEATHVAYRGGSQGAQALASGDTQYMLASTPAAIGLVQAGRLRVLAVAGATRLAAHPNTPTLAEAAPPGFDFAEWTGLWAPAGTPEPVLDRLAAAVAHAMARPEVQARFTELGVDAGSYLARADFARYVAEQRALMTRLTTEAGIRPE